MKGRGKKKKNENEKEKIVFGEKTEEEMGGEEQREEE